MGCVSRTSDDSTADRARTEFLDASDIVRQFVQLSGQFLDTICETLVLGDGASDVGSDTLGGGALSETALAVTDGKADDVVIRELSARDGGLKFDTKVCHGRIECLAGSVGRSTERSSLGRNLTEASGDIL